MSRAHSSSKKFEICLRKMSIRTTCLHSVASRWPRRTYSAPSSPVPRVPKLAAIGRRFFPFSTIRRRSVKCQYFQEKLLDPGAADRSQGEEGGYRQEYALSAHPGPSQAPPGRLGRFWPSPQGSRLFFCSPNPKTFPKNPQKTQIPSILPKLPDYVIFTSP